MEVVSNFKGFTILELIVAMAIVAVLVGLSLLGIQTVQRSSRDTARRTFVDSINLEINDYYGNNRVYPTVVITPAAFPRTVATVGGNKTVTLTGAGVALAVASTTSTISGSAYCYYGGGSTLYSIGVNLEAGTWFTEGNGAGCTATNII